MADSTKKPLPQKSPAPQKRGACGHMMASFDSHARCSRCRDNKKGSDPCVLDQPCDACMQLTPGQLAQLAQPKYRERKEKSKKSTTPTSPTQNVDPSEVAVLGTPTDEDRALLQPGPSETTGKSKKRRKSGTPVRPPVDCTPTKSSAGLTSPEQVLRPDVTVSQVDLVAMSQVFQDQLKQQTQAFSDSLKEERQTWSERFSRLEAKLLSHTISAPPAASSSSQPAARSSTPPATSRSSLPVEPPASPAEPEPEPELQIEVHDETPSSDGEVSDSADQEESQPVVVRPTPSSSQSRAVLTSSSLPPTGIASLDTDAGTEMSYRETMSALRHTMKWKIPDREGETSTRNLPWIQKRGQPPSRLALHLPVDEHLCEKMGDLHISATQGASSSSRTTESTPLGRNQFIRGPSRQRWYAMYHPPESDSSSESSGIKWWSQEAQRLNSTFHRLCKPGSSPAPSSLSVSQDNLRRWERQHRDQTVIINQTAGIVRGQTAMKDKTDALLKTLNSELDKYSLPDKISDTLSDLTTALEVNYQLTTAISGALQDLSEGIFVNLGNAVLMRRDSFLDSLRPGINSDTLSRLRTGPFHTETLFPEDVILAAESELHLLDQKKPDHQEKSSARYHPYQKKGTDSGSRSDWRRFSKKKSTSSSTVSTTKPAVKSQVTKPAQTQKKHK